MSRSIREHLAANLGADAAGRSRDEHDSALKEAGDLFILEFHHLAAEQVMDVDVTRLNRHRPTEQRIDVGHHLDANINVVAFRH